MQPPFRLSSLVYTKIPPLSIQKQTYIYAVLQACPYGHSRFSLSKCRRGAATRGSDRWVPRVLPSHNTQKGGNRLGRFRHGKSRHWLPYGCRMPRAGALQLPPPCACHCGRGYQIIARCSPACLPRGACRYSTVTLFARFLGISGSSPRSAATSSAKSSNATAAGSGISIS